MGLNKIILIIGMAVLAIQLTNAASIVMPSNNCKCTREYLPICGSDETTYSNACLFECAKKQKADLEIKYYGECDDESNLLLSDEQCKCLRHYRPVCGTDGKTYTNECMLDCAKRDTLVDMKYNGECGYESRTLPGQLIQSV